ncbi:MAG: hypothetical protein P0Y53_06015 [Candidatus Pseudobacter hemicellulosilyticus]|uniref:Uncharacterized protein n=1 Tax=Candidatus Pseudobacter hemicellulosilyticus TaxID=3121375 RepID=A0AAJ5WWU4_9BACT|nr:MAG: hypothetical protein P0Y53_06015 [Pseudobacter sp.]
MKSTNNEKQLFSMADFEKGLMLAGLVTPTNLQELQEFQDLQKYDKEVAAEKKMVYFKRVVLAAEIANELHKEPSFGRIKFQKLMYMCEEAAQMNLHSRYLKQAAGPFDNKFMHSIEKEFKKNQWFEVIKVESGGGTRSVYKPLPNLKKYKDYYNSYFLEEADSIRYVIDLFRKQKTDFTEVAATLYACHNNLKAQKNAYSFDELKDQFYSWSDRKSKFDIALVTSIGQWLQEKNLIL